MDLDSLIKEWNKLTWEKKGLVVLGIIVLVIVIYAFNPFHSSSNPQIAPDQSTVTPTVLSPSPAVTSNNSTANNTTANMTTGNGTFQISADMAKNIALGNYTGYTAGTPTQGTKTINNTVFQVWIVPITNGAISHKVYIDLTSGIIIGTE